MPPKKAKINASGAGTLLADEDLSDVATLPKLNDFIFANMYAFKYKKNKLNLEKSLFKRLYMPPDGETAELAKTHKVIQLSDLLAQAKARQYMTEDECSRIEELDPVKVRQVLARVTNELMASILVPARRAKVEEEEKFYQALEKVEDEAEKKQ